MASITTVLSKLKVLSYMASREVKLPIHLCIDTYTGVVTRGGKVDGSEIVFSSPVARQLDENWECRQARVGVISIASQTKSSAHHYASN